MPEKELLSTGEVAEEKGCTRQTVINAINRGDLTAIRAGKVWVVKVDEKYHSFQVSEKNRPYRQDDNS